MAEAVVRFGACELDERGRELRHDGKLQHVEPQVFDVLAYLVRHRDRVVTKAELLDEVWGSRFVGESALTSRIKAARQAVGDSGAEQAVIRTVHGRGYRFVASTEPAPDPGGVGAPTLAGRAFALERLGQRLAEARGGARRTVLVSGEAGIGKTTLTEAFVGRLSPDAALVARGHCLEQHGTGEPYLPVFDALSRLCRGPGATAVIEVLSSAAPSWLLQMPSLVPGGALADLRARSFGASGQRMLRELVDAVELLAADRLFVLVLEDLHWGDAPTAELFDWLARRTDPARLLLIGTYRPSPGADDDFSSRARDLAVRGHAEELRLDRLTEAEVTTVLAPLLPGLPATAATLVHDLTSGVPLFVRDLVSSWVDAGVVDQDGDGRWGVRSDLDELARTVPRSVHVLLERDLARLHPDDVQLLEAAAVVGVGFAAPAVAAATGQPEEDVEARCTALARRGRLVVADGVETWEDGTVSAVFRFLHQLHRQVLYDRVPPARRARYHVAVGRRLEEGYGPQVGEHLGMLAAHFDRGGDAARAADYLGRAGEQAMVLGAHREALAHFDAALRHTARLPEGPERDRAELQLQLRRAMALVVTHGWAAVELDGAYHRADTLCRRLPDPPERHVVTVGLATVEEMRGHHEQTEALVDAGLEAGPTDLLVETYELVACSAFHLGRFEKAIDEARRGLAHYRADVPNEEYARHGVDVGAACHGWAAFAAWFLGRPDDSRAFIEQARAVASGQPYARATASIASAFLHQYRDEPLLVQKWAEDAMALVSEHGYPFRIVQGHIMRGWARAAEGDEDGLAELGEALEAYRSSGAYIEWPYFLGIQADALLATGRPGEALDRVTEALEEALGTPGFFYEPELHRLRAVALQASRPDGSATDEAHAALRRGLELAGAQGSPTARLRLLLTSLEVGGGDDDTTEVESEIRASLAALPAAETAPDVVRARERGMGLPSPPRPPARGRTPM